MNKPIAATRSRAENNEDFIFHCPVGEAIVMIVGDFARLNYANVDTTAHSLLVAIVEKNGPLGLEPPVLLSQIASEFNNRLIDYGGVYSLTFQCCAVFAIVDGDRLYYLPVGDCRIAVYRHGSMVLLNETIWREDSGNLLPPVINADRKVIRGGEEPPAEALGIGPRNFLPADVRDIDLQKDDAVVLYSDGVDKFLSPVKLIELIGNGEKNKKEDTAENIIDAVSVARGDDDRSVMLFFGPHLSRAESLDQKLHDLRAENSTKLDEIINGRVATFRKIEEEMREKLKELEDVNNKLDRVQNTINDLKNAADGAPNKAEVEHIMRQLIAGAQNAGRTGADNTEVLTQLTEGFRQVEKKLNELKVSEITKGKKAAGGKVEQSAIAPEVPGQIALDEMQESTPVDEKFSPFGELADLDCSREGVIIFCDGKFVLVDEGRSVPWIEKADLGKAITFKSPENKPGLLTGFHLYLRTDVSIGRKLSRKDEIQSYVEKEWEIFFDKLGTQYNFLTIKEKHWKIRDWYARWGFWKWRYARLVKKELKLSKKEAPFRTPFEHPDGHTYWNIKGNLHIFRLLIVTFCILIAAGLIALYLGYPIPGFGGKSSDGNSNVSNTPEPVNGRLKVGADGRTIYFHSTEGGEEKLDRRIKVGQEENGSKAIEDLKEKTKAELEDELGSREHFIAWNSSDDIRDNSFKFVIINSEHIKEVNRLAQTNPSLPECQAIVNAVQIQTSPSTLKDRNPNIDCAKLKEGNQFLAVPLAPKKTRK